ncbi:MAG: hypothetical protein E7455_03250 [Ruminococcaceae bacterium]|nr:hypothetical protein [Oscillospiraceae bacterium]
MYYTNLFDQIELCQEGRDLFNRLHSRNIDENAAYAAYQEGDEAFVAYLDTFAAEQNVDVSEANLYLYLLFSKRTYAYYKSKGIDDSVFFTSMKVLAWDCNICYEKTGFYGIRQVTYRAWFRRVINGTIFRLGRLEFEIFNSIYDFDLDGHHISKGDTCIYVHIPGGTPLNYEECEAAYDIARKFFKEHFRFDPVIFYCGSWLLHPWLAEVLPATSRIVIFQSQFQLADVVEDETTVRNWLFDHSDAPFEDLPENTSLQKIGKQRFLNGQPMGYGRGYRF